LYCIVLFLLNEPHASAIAVIRDRKYFYNSPDYNKLKYI